MGQECTKPPVATGGEFRVPRGANGHELVKQEIARGEGEMEELLKIPGAEVVIMGADGGGGSVVEGQFIFARLAKPSQMSVLFVGVSLEDLSEGFYYPLLAETPVCLSGDKVITVDAGGGDVFGIRLPQHLSDAELQGLMELLGASCAFEVQKTRKKDTVDKVTAGLLKTGAALTKGIELATEGLSLGIRKGGEAGKRGVTPAKPVEVGAGTQMAVAGARVGTQAAVKVSGVVLDGLMSTALELGKQAGKEMGKRSNANSNTNTVSGSQKEHGAVRLGKAGFLAGAQVFDALLSAGDRLATEAADETAGVVGAKYGEGAGKVARDGLGIAGDLRELHGLVGKKAVGKLAAKAALYSAQGLAQGAAAGASSNQ